MAGTGRAHGFRGVIRRDRLEAGHQSSNSTLRYVGTRLNLRSATGTFRAATFVTHEGLPNRPWQGALALSDTIPARVRSGVRAAGEAKRRVKDREHLC